MDTLRIDRLDDPRLEVFRGLKRSNLTRWSGLLIAEGEKVVTRLLQSRCEVVSLLATPRMLERLRPIRLRGPVFVVDDDLARLVTGYAFHAGVLACGRRPEPPAWDEHFRPAETPASIVMADRITDPDNLGTIVRLAAAFGCPGLVLGKGSADPFSRRALRVAVGTTFQIPIFEGVDLEQAIRQLRRQGNFEAVATTLDPAAEPLEEVQHFSPRRAILLGNEAAGLPPEICRLCDLQVRLPMADGVDSLNVATAAAIFLYELVARRPETGLPPDPRHTND